VVFRSPGERIEPEAGFVAGKKVGNAVARNRAKRRLREAARRVDLAPGIAYVFVATDQVLHVPFTTLVAWMERAVDDDEAVVDVRG
jgi:ribonuclease P protein component